MEKDYPNMTDDRFVIKVLHGVAEVFFKKNDGGLLNIKSHEFINTKDEWTWLHNKHKESVDGFPKIWTSGGEIPTFPLGRLNHYFNVVAYTSRDTFPYIRVLDYPVFNFKVFVSDKSYFLSKLPILQIKTSREKASWSDNLDYYQTIFSIYCSSLCCGVSKEHLTPSTNVHPIITSIMRFHVYFTTRRLITRMQKGESMSAINREFNATDIYGKSDRIPWDYRYKSYKDDKGRVLEKSYKVFKNANYKDDYQLYVPQKSTGFTNIGLRYIQKSVEAYTYCILGAQTKTRWSIVNNDAKSLQRQSVFRQLVEDTIIQSDPTVTISNMRRAIADTNVLLNLALSPGIILVPSNMIILEKPIPGYSNILTSASSKMRFGVNSKVNYVGLKKESKKVHQPDAPSSHLDDLDDSVKHRVTNKSDSSIKRQVVDKSDGHDTELLTLFGVMGIVSLLTFKYVLYI